MIEKITGICYFWIGLFLTLKQVYSDIRVLSIILFVY
uniref:Uncharacterized protein n=1 Tax=Myoviridae sp. ctOpw2 TaxID=2825093 RepID=A0A8S5UCZ3_9CAUD|nr:MAG TPA: hypothetical protein [Myoviridae sp. ctOpw2]DAL73917.1 MAG TPA: hypothetical protein [Caudoviricetes sp.]